VSDDSTDFPDPTETATGREQPEMKGTIGSKAEKPAEPPFPDPTEPEDRDEEREPEHDD
jgi:hypothetical protein